MPPILLQKRKKINKITHSLSLGTRPALRRYSSRAVMLASAFMAAPSIWCHARGVIRDAGVASAIRRGAHSISVEEEKKKKGKKV